MLTVIDAIVSKLVALLIGYLWNHHKDKMQSAAQAQQQQRIQAAQEASTHATQQADADLVRGAVTVGTVAHADSLSDGSDALNAELHARD